MRGESCTRLDLERAMNDVRIPHCPLDLQEQRNLRHLGETILHMRAKTRKARMGRWAFVARIFGVGAVCMLIFALL